MKTKLNVGETIFTTISQMAREYDAINLGQGFPDFKMDDELIGLVNEAMLEGHNQYAPARGVQLLRNEISKKINFLYNTHVNPDTEICVTPGATYAIYTTITALIHPGDEVIIFEPAYDSYIPNIEINGGKAIPISLTFPDYKIDWQKVKDAVTSKTKMIVINTPHNPSGSVLSADDMEALATISKGNNLWILSDEVYEPIIFDGHEHESVLKYPDLFERSIAVYSFGKVYHCTGWKTGYCVAPKNIMDEIVKVHQYNAFCCFSPVQFALAKYLEHKEKYIQLGKFYEAKRDLLQNELNSAGLIPLPSHGSFFQLFDYFAISDKDDRSMAEYLIKNAGVAAIPISSFYAKGNEQKVLRFCFAKDEQTIKEAGNRLRDFLNK